MQFSQKPRRVTSRVVLAPKNQFFKGGRRWAGQGSGPAGGRCVSGRRWPAVAVGGGRQQRWSGRSQIHPQSFWLILYGMSINCDLCIIVVAVICRSTYGIRSIVFYIYIALYGAYPILGIMFAVLFILCYLVEVYYMIAIRSFSTSIYRSSIPSKIYQRSRSTMKTDFTNWCIYICISWVDKLTSPDIVRILIWFPSDWIP